VVLVDGAAYWQCLLCENRAEPKQYMVSAGTHSPHREKIVHAARRAALAPRVPRGSRVGCANAAWVPQGDRDERGKRANASLQLDVHGNAPKGGRGG
jgi:hypothetical protein